MLEAFMSRIVFVHIKLVAKSLEKRALCVIMLVSHVSPSLLPHHTLNSTAYTRYLSLFPDMYVCHNVT
jgi:hypothetical protein